ncbi:MAG: hypothetical protein EAZ30_14770 [Betaproteobacteria bacterium]|nr:MAG: hypothetical protein EAZ30_14770 [Betaproteobacteria bacterium]
MIPTAQIQQTASLIHQTTISSAGSPEKSLHLVHDSFFVDSLALATCHSLFATRASIRTLSGAGAACKAHFASPRHDYFLQKPLPAARGNASPVPPPRAISLLLQSSPKGHP